MDEYQPYLTHPQLPHVADILLRKNTHHLFVFLQDGIQCINAFLDACTQHLNQSITRVKPNFKYEYLTELPPDHLTQQIARWQAQLHSAENVIIAFSPSLSDQLNSNTLNIPNEILTKLKLHPSCRLIFFIHNTHFSIPAGWEHQAAFLRIDRSTIHNQMLLLEQQIKELELFHQISIPASLISLAYDFALHYLNPEENFHETLLLLDSSAAYAQATLSSAPTTLTRKDIIQALSHRTGLALSHFESTGYERSRFVSRMQQVIFGQDHAIQKLGEALDRTFSPLNTKPGPRFAALLAGPAHSGKQALAQALAIELFQSTSAFFYANLNSSMCSLLELKLQRATDQQSFSLKEVLTHYPFAIILFKHLDRVKACVNEEISAILASNYSVHPSSPCFSRCILLFSIDVERTAFTPIEEVALLKQPETNHNLLSLIMPTQHPSPQAHSPTQELPLDQANIAEQLGTAFTQYLQNRLTLLVFFPLNKAAMSFILRSKLEKLCQDFKKQQGISLTYAPEIIRYLIHLYSNTDESHIENLLDPVYQVIERSLLHSKPSEDSLLRLQLNDTGQLLRCDLLSSAGQHSC